MPAQQRPEGIGRALGGDVGTGRRVTHEIALRRLEDAEDEVVGREEQAPQISDRPAFPAERGGLLPGGSRSVLELALVDAGPVALGRVEHAASRNGPYGCVPQSMYRGITFVIGPSRRRCRPSRRIVASAYLSPFWSRNTIRLPSGANEPRITDIGGPTILLEIDPETDEVERVGHVGSADS